MGQSKTTFSVSSKPTQMAEPARLSDQHMLPTRLEPSAEVSLPPLLFSMLSSNPFIARPNT
jgi:hypothetical protein